MSTAIPMTDDEKLDQDLAKQYQPSTDLGKQIRSENPLLNGQNHPQASRFAGSATPPMIAPPGETAPAPMPISVPQPKAPTETGSFPSLSPAASEPTPLTGKPDPFAKPLGAPGGQDHFLSDLYKKDITDYRDKQQNPWGSPGNHDNFLGKLGHVAAKVGNIAGDIFAPQAMAMIPGTQLHDAFKERNDESRYADAKKEEDANVNTRDKNTNAEGKYAFHYPGADGKTYGVRQDGAVEELPAGSEKPKMSIQKFTVQDPDGKSHEVMGMVDETKLASLHPADPTKGLTPEEMIKGGAFTKMDMGQSGAKPGSQHPLYKMVPTGPDTEALALMDPTDPTKHTIISPSKKTGSLQAWVNPNDPTAAPRLFDTKAGTFSAVPGDKAPNGPQGTVAPLVERAMVIQKNQFQQQYQKPATDIDQNYQKFQEAYKQYQNNPETGAASMVALAQHLGSTFGSVKGSTMGENMIAEHKDAIGLFDSIGRYMDSLSSGQQLTPGQWKEFGSLISKTREIQWETTAHEAARQHFPVDMVPRDVKLHMMTPGGKQIPVAGDKIQDALNDGMRF